MFKTFETVPVKQKPFTVDELILIVLRYWRHQNPGGWLPKDFIIEKVKEKALELNGKPANERSILRRIQALAQHTPQHPKGRINRKEEDSGEAVYQHRPT